MWGTDNSENQHAVPPPNGDFLAIAAGAYHNLGLKSNGVLVHWGCADYFLATLPAPNWAFVGLSAGAYGSLGVKAHYGDLNCDGAVNFGDINPFITLVSNPAAWKATYPRCHLLNGDCNGNGIVDFEDINSFQHLLR